MILESPIDVEHPTELARQIAHVLDTDPIAARQVREFLGDDRLYELLELPPQNTETLEEALECCDVPEEDIAEKLAEQYGMGGFSDQALVDESRRRKLLGSLLLKVR